MVHPYLNRRAGREPVTYPHPSLEPILARTLGVPLFQEQLLRMAMVAAGFTGGQAEELRRAMGFKRSEKRMKQIEVQLREGMARQGITGDAAEQIITSITSFALYGFPESHAASFALLAYASAYLKAHYPAAFYTALLNNQPMGFYHPATLVKDAQRRGVRFHADRRAGLGLGLPGRAGRRVRLGLLYVNGLRQATGRAIAAGPSRIADGPMRADLRSGYAGRVASRSAVRSAAATMSRCSKRRQTQTWFCNICAHEWGRPNADAVSRPDAAADRHPADRRPAISARSTRSSPQRGVRRDELATLAEIGALN